MGEDTYEVQKIIYNGMKNLERNMKKDGASRKSVDYYKRQLENLEKYWQEYEVNHERLCIEMNRKHVYFTAAEFEETRRFYYLLKNNINDEYQSFVDKQQQGSQEGDDKNLQQKETPGTGTIAEQPGTSNMNQELRFSNITKAKKVSQGTNSKLDDMMRKQTANFKAFMRTVANIDVEAIREKWEFEDVLKSLQTRWSVIDSLHWEIDGELNEENEEYENLFTKHEKQFNNLKKAINTKMWSVAHREKSTPQMDIPSFSGNYNQWVSFKDLFTESIHCNPAISNAQKMQFLKGKVKGEAERLIQHLHISSENYTTCWEILNHRFDNKKLIFTSHMNTLMGLPNIQQQSGAQIKKLHDVTVECLNSIKNLGVNINTWDPILVHIITQKLDSETYSDYIESLKNARELPILQEFLDYLETKFTSLESARRKQDSGVQKPNYAHPSTSQQSTYNKKQYTNNYQQKYQNNFYNKPPMAKSLHASSFTCPQCNDNHGLYNCKQFKEMSDEMKLKTVNKLRLCLNCLFSHNGNKCFSTKKCRNCLAQHNTMLHEACTNAKQNTPSSSTSTRQNETTGNTSLASQDTSEILLATAQVKVKDVNGTYQILRALIDQGSQISLITERTAQTLGIKRQRCKGVIFGVGQKENSCKGMLNILCRSMYNDFQFSAEVLIMNNLIKNLPNKSFNKPSWQHIQNINLADPEFYNSRTIDILFGADIYARIMQSGIIKGDESSQPIAQQTHLGWLLCGNVQTFQCNVVLNDIDDIQKFWEIEDISEQSNLSLDEQECVNYYNETTKRKQDGRYEVRLPLKEGFKDKLGSSKKTAIAQFRNLEKKFEKQKSLSKEYKSFMQEYIELEHMKIVNSNETPDCYLPHHGVQRAESTTTKYRVVFNASAPTSTGYSLNDLMHKGPNLQQDLQSLLLKWRQFRYAYTADIEKMYRQILVNELDQPLQKIVWRESPQHQIQSYQLATVTYGTKAAPFLAMMTLKKLAADEREKYPQVVKILEGSFYMDDLVHGSHTLEDGKRIIADLISLLKLGGFNLRKWRTNNNTLMDKQDQQSDTFNFKTVNTSKTLGLRWDPTYDVFTFDNNICDKSVKPTKRILLSEISKLYDPLGWLTPLSTKLKLLFQKIWKTSLQWDDLVSEDINQEWSKIKTDIKNIQQCKIPRWTGCKQDDVIELHGFCDASLEAFGCIILARVKNQQKTIIVAAKSKLVPHKKALSLPKLELSGAHLLAKLMKKVKQTFSQQKTEIFGWTDSMVVLGWLQGDPNRWKPFVANRVKIITEEMKPDCWRYVRSSDNPADAASRGLYASQLTEHALWWHGPEWLTSFDADQDKKQTYTTNQEEKLKQSNITQKTCNNINIIDTLLQKYSSITKPTRVLAWILRALATWQLTSKQKQLPSYLTLHELRNAKTMIVKHVQRCEFETDLQHLHKHGKVHAKSKLLELKPFISKDGLLRVGGRLKHSNIALEMKHPKLIPRDSRLSHLLIEEAHQLVFHGGARLTLSQLRQQYWVTGGSNAVKKQLRRCVTCKKQENKKQSQVMGDLPAARCNPASPFFHTGVDYTGFVDVKSNKGKGIRSTKGYVAVFVCMVTKAVHLELVSDLSSSAFMAALRRMSARRGAPRHLYSDNGSNFIGANRILQEELQQIQEAFDDKCMTEITEMNIEWHFNAPSWPSAGGLWERAVRSLKYHLKRIIGQQKLTFEEYSTILAQLEACLNTRPLCPLSEDVEDLDFLTPAHFLTGRPGLTVIETAEDARTRWHLTQQLFQEIWKRWKSEYLTQLTVRNKWREQNENMKLGDLVVINDDNLLSGKWSMGRVVEIHPGADNVVRVVTLKTKNGFLKRPITKLSLLPINSENGDSTTTPQTKKSSETNKIKPNKTYSKHSKLVSIALALTFFMTIITSSYAAFNITKLKEDQSLYFDPLTKMQLIRDKWILVVYYNMAPYWEGTTVLERLITHLDKTCAITFEQNNRCNMILTHLRHERAELQYYNQLLLNQHLSEPSRQRRGLINGVGYLANALFGVLDERFAEKYTKDIELIKNNQAHLTALWRNQTSIVESEYNVLKRTEDYVTQQHKIINKHLNVLETAANRLQTEVNQIAQMQDFTLTAVTASNLLMNLKGSQDMLLDTITDISHGEFNIHLLTPTQLKEELNIISSHLTDETTLPIENIQRDVQKIYKLLRIKARVTEQYFLFEVTFPLVNRDKFKLYQTIPIPHQVNRSLFNIIPISNYIAVNLRRDSYLSITVNELAACLNQEETLLCQLKKPIYHLNSDNDFCELEDKAMKCKTQKSTCINTWIPLNRASEYLYYCCNTYTVKIICGDQITIQRLDRAGVITLDQNCIIKGQDVTLYAHKTHENTLQMDVPASIPNIDQINQVVNLSLLIDSNLNDLKELPRMNSSLEDIEQQIKKMKEHSTLQTDSLSSHDIHQYVIIYGVVAVGIITAAVFLWRSRRRLRRAVITPDVELQSRRSSDSERVTKPVNVNHQPSSSNEPKDKACSPISRRFVEK